MSIVLSEAGYGKSEVRLVKVSRGVGGDAGHDLHDERHRHLRVEGRAGARVERESVAAAERRRREQLGHAPVGIGRAPTDRLPARIHRTLE